jgi:hypothetical protein
MALASGTHVGSYEILSSLGAGGMSIASRQGPIPISFVESGLSINDTGRSASIAPMS